MKKIPPFLIALLLACTLSNGLHGQVCGKQCRLSAEVYFPIGKSAVDLDFEGNRSRLRLFLDSLSVLLADPEYVIERIVVTGTASPDGTEEQNRLIAGGRARSLADYLTAHSPLPRQRIELVNGGENWSALWLMMEESAMPYRAAMLSLMDIPDRDERKNRMMFYAESKPWLWMYAHFFPVLRKGAGSLYGHTMDSRMPLFGSGISVYYTSVRLPETVSLPAALRRGQRLSAVISPAGTPHDALSSAHHSRPFTPVLSLKTDLMLWGGVMPGFEMGTWTPNLSAEVHFARRWSVQAGYAYSDWNALTGSKELYALSVADLEVRLWTGKPSRFRGFYLGLYGQYGQYDVRESPKGQTGTFWSTGAGIGAGLLLPLGRRWGIEFEARGGYRSAENDHYTIDGGHNYFNSRMNTDKFTGQFRVQLLYRFGKSGNPVK